LAVLAAFDGAAPQEMAIGVAGFGAVEPGAVAGTVKQINARFFDEVRLIGCEDDGEIAIRGIVAHAATFEVAVVGGHGFATFVARQCLPSDAFGFEFHKVIVTRANGFKVMT